MLVALKNILYDLGYMFTNYFVAYIPSWIIRKSLYRLLGMHIGKGSRINMRCIIMAPYRICIGENTIINEFCLLDGRGGLTIGNNTSISMYAKIYTATHKSYSEEFEYITNAVVMPGSIVEDFNIISVNSVFKGKTKPNEMWRGNPATYFKNRDVKSKYTLKNKMWWR